MTQDGFGKIGCFEDFGGLSDPDGVTLTSGTSVRYNDIILIPVSGHVTLTNLVDEGGGVASFTGAGDTGDGIGLVSSPMQPSGNGMISMGARFKYSAVTDMQAFVGFQETVDTDAPVTAFTLNGTTLTSNSAGQVVGLYRDTTADTDDWRMHAATDSEEFVEALGALGTRANATPVLDEYMVIRVELDPDGTARCYYGESRHTPARTLGLKLVDTLPAGNLDPDALYHPIAMLLSASTGDPDFEVDYFWAKGSRNWTDL